MSAFARRVAEVTGIAEAELETLAAESVSEVLLVRRPNGALTVAKSGPALGAEARMLRELAGAGLPAPAVEGEHDGVLLLEHVENDGVFSPRAWADIGARIRRLHNHRGETYGWLTIMRSGRSHRYRGAAMAAFLGRAKLVATAACSTGPRGRVDRLAGAARPASGSAASALLHGDLWTGTCCARRRLVVLIDPACSFGDGEVGLAMLDLFGSPPEAFHEAYGPLEPGWRERRPIYQLFPALVHVRLWGPSYLAMTERLLSAVGA